MNGDLATHNRHANVLRWMDPPCAGVSIAWAVDDSSVPGEDLLTALPSDELATHESMPEEDERRHFLFRRAFQRLFLAKVISSKSRLRDLELVHGLDRRPFCSDAPDLGLSFSSSQRTYLFAAAKGVAVGVDVEKLREVSNAVQLAQRFFTSAESDFLASHPESERSRAFLSMWSVKEAGLKALGRGIVNGINTFRFVPDELRWSVQPADDSLEDPTLNVVHLPQPPGFVSVMVTLQSG